jgi:hypothetical protein
MSTHTEASTGPEIIFTRPVPAPAFDAHREAILSILRGAGFSTERSVEELTAITCFAVGYAHFERIWRDVDRNAEAERLDRLPPAEYPCLREVANIYPIHLQEGAFDAGLSKHHPRA